jgi:hypothetical protein
MRRRKAKSKAAHKPRKPGRLLKLVTYFVLSGCGLLKEGFEYSLCLLVILEALACSRPLVFPIEVSWSTLL